MLSPDKTIAYFSKRFNAYLPVDEPKIRAAVERINEIFPAAIGRIGRIPVSTIIWFSSSGLNYGARIEPVIFYYDIGDNAKEANPPWIFSQQGGELFLDKPMIPLAICYKPPKKTKAGKKKGQIIREEQETAKEEDEASRDVMTEANTKGRTIGGMF